MRRRRGRSRGEGTNRDQVPEASVSAGGRSSQRWVYDPYLQYFTGEEFFGHTLAAVIAETQSLTGREVERAYVDKGYCGHDAPRPLRVLQSGQKRGVFGVIKTELRRRAAIEAAIGHMKIEGHLGRNYLKGRHGDQANAVLTAVGYNFRLILNWQRALLRLILTALLDALTPRSAIQTA